MLGETVRLRVEISQYSNPETYLVGEVEFAEDDVILGTWVRLDWMWFNGALVYCMIGRSLESEEEALALLEPTPLDFPGSALCNETPWTLLTWVE